MHNCLSYGCAATKMSVSQADLQTIADYFDHLNRQLNYAWPTLPAPVPIIATGVNVAIPIAIPQIPPEKSAIVIMKH